MAATPDRYVKVDSSGNLLGFFPSDIWPIPPEGAVKITEAQYQQWLGGQGARPPQYYQLVNGALISYTPT